MTGYQNLDNLIKDKKILYIPIYSCFDYSGFGQKGLHQKGLHRCLFFWYIVCYFRFVFNMFIIPSKSFAKLLIFPLPHNPNN